jgi:hypothetical protein
VLWENSGELFDWLCRFEDLVCARWLCAVSPMRDSNRYRPWASRQLLYPQSVQTLTCTTCVCVCVCVRVAAARARRVVAVAACAGSGAFMRSLGLSVLPSMAVVVVSDACVRREQSERKASAGLLPKLSHTIDSDAMSLLIWGSLQCRNTRLVGSAPICDVRRIPLSSLLVAGGALLDAGLWQQRASGAAGARTRASDGCGRRGRGAGGGRLGAERESGASTAAVLRAGGGGGLRPSHDGAHARARLTVSRPLRAAVHRDGRAALGLSRRHVRHRYR